MVYKIVWIIDEIKKRIIIKIVKLNIIFSHPLFSTVVEDRMFDRDSELLFWRKIKTVKKIDNIIWITTKVVFIFCVCFYVKLNYKYIELYQ